MTDSAVVMHVQDNDFDFHDTPNCWQRVRQAIFDAIAAAQASP